jgi:hypothetical protein
LCQRYYQSGTAAMGGYCTAAVGIISSKILPVPMRASPTIGNSGQVNSGCTSSTIVAIDLANVKLTATGTGGPGFASASNYTAAAEL